MIRTFIRYLKGYVKIRVEGYSPERFLNMCCYHQIFLWGLAPAGNSYEMYMSVRGFKKIRPFVRKTHTKVTVTERHGFPFFLRKYRKRKLFFAGIFLCIALIRGYSLFIWDIHFEGNERRTDQALLEFLGSQGTAPCMLKKDVDCPGIVKAIREEYNDIVWVSASVDGSRLKIQIKENEDTLTEGSSEEDTADSPETDAPTDLIAQTDGVITSIVTRSGVPQVHVGDTVSAGDILVLGRVDVLNDSGEVVGYQYQKSDADIFADTQLQYTDSMPLDYQEKVYDNKKKYQLYLKFFDWTISFGSVKNNWEHNEVYTQETQLKLGENFYLPFSYGKKEARSYVFRQKTYTETEIQEKLSANFNVFCEELEEKGIQIRKNDVKIQLDKNSAAASGTLYLNQQITEEADTEILTIERNEPNESGGTDD